MANQFEVITKEGLQTFLTQLRPHINEFTSSSTGGGLQAKTATISKFILTRGVRIIVLFEDENTANQPTLAINIGNEAEPKLTYAYEIVKVDGSSLTGDDAKRVSGLCELVFDGVHWVLFSKQESRSQIVYSATEEPKDPFIGMVWLKKKTSGEKT